MSRDQMIEASRRMEAAVACPVTAGIEAGSGDTDEAKLDTMRQVVAAGAVGINSALTVIRNRRSPIITDSSRPENDVIGQCDPPFILSFCHGDSMRHTMFALRGKSHHSRPVACTWRMSSLG